MFTSMSSDVVRAAMVGPLTAAPAFDAARPFPINEFRDAYELLVNGQEFAHPLRFLADVRAILAFFPDAADSTPIADLLLIANNVKAGKILAPETLTAMNNVAQFFGQFLSMSSGGVSAVCPDEKAVAIGMMGDALAKISAAPPESVAGVLASIPWLSILMFLLKILAAVLFHV